MQTQTTPRQINPASALASAMEDFDTEVSALYEAPNTDRDHLELEALARITVAYVRNANALLSRMNFANGAAKYDLTDLIVDAFDDELQHGALEVLRRHVKKMEVK